MATSSASPATTLPAELLDRLRARHAEPHRHYHVQRHVDAMRAGLAEHRALAARPELIEAAIWFHDAVYDPARRDNEARSADLARAELGTLGWPAADVARVAELVLATAAHEAPAGDTDAALLLDLDLAILGQAPDVYARYVADVRAEYAVDDARWREGRRTVLRHFLDRPAIYATPPLRAKYEAAARRNIVGELAALD